MNSVSVVSPSHNNPASVSPCLTSKEEIAESSLFIICLEMFPIELIFSIQCIGEIKANDNEVNFFDASLPTPFRFSNIANRLAFLN